MDNTTWNEVNSTLDLNGPILSYSEQPTGATGIGTTAGSTGGGSVSFTGIATGVDPGTGYISYEWYEQDVGTFKFGFLILAILIFTLICFVFYFYHGRRRLQYKYAALVQDSSEDLTYNQRCMSSIDEEEEEECYEEYCDKSRLKMSS